MKSGAPSFDQNSFTNLGDALNRIGAPDDTAIIDLSGDHPPRTFTYQALDQLANGIARGLVNKGLLRGERVAILAHNRAEYVAALLAIMRAGLVAVPMNNRVSASSVEFMLRDTEVAHVFCDKAHAHLCPPNLRRIIFDEDCFDRLVDAGAFVPVLPDCQETALILYTSGSTGRPKGVVLSHRNHLWILQERSRGAPLATERYLVAAPLYHLNALAVCQTALAQRNTIVLLPNFSSRSFIEAISAFGCTSITAVPTMIAMILQEKKLLARTDLSSVRAVRMGSAPASESLIGAIREAFPTAEISTRYGTTEVGPIVFAPHPDGRPTPPCSVGARHPKVDLRLASEGASDATEGSLQVRSPAVMLRYHNLPGDTERAFTSDGYYITKDVFRRDENGFFYFVGRTDDMFVCGGENIYPREIEKILEAHPKVSQVVVVPTPDNIKGNKPVAFVVPRKGYSLEEGELREFFLTRGALYQHPRRVWFIDELPLGGTNKADRALLTKTATGLLIESGELSDTSENTTAK